VGRILNLVQPRKIEVDEYKEEPLGCLQIRIKTLYSGISAGTQLTLYRGENPFVEGDWNPVLRIFEDIGEPAMLYPVDGMWAYEEVGKVVEVGSGVTKVKAGDVIFGAWGHKSTHIADEEYAATHKLVEGVEPICAIFAQMGAISLNAVIDANIHAGETVAVFGQGVPGQIVAQLSKLSGARVIAVDLDETRLDFAKRSGADIVLNPKDVNVGKEIKELTGGKGADVSIEISGSIIALNEAIKSTCYNGCVVCSGFITGEAKGLFLGREFHHNRIKIICSQIENVSLSASNRWDKLRMENTIMNLQKEGKIDLSGLITHIVDFEKASEAYDMLDRQTNCLQVVLKFEQ
jgi:2-desacetyl-2-hydroxyethyl bacteriochlorophyllide A dehydrogenase